MAGSLIKVCGVAVAIAAGFGAFQLWSGSNQEASAEVSSLGPLGECGQAGYARYRQVSAELSEFASGQSRDFRTQEAQDNMRARLNAMTFDDGKTHFIAGHGETEEIFAVTCEDRLCTNDEAFAPEQECLTKHLGGCSMIAAVDNGTLYCLIGD